MSNYTSLRPGKTILLLFIQLFIFRIELHASPKAHNGPQHRIVSIQENLERDESYLRYRLEGEWIEAQLINKYDSKDFKISASKVINKLEDLDKLTQLFGKKSVSSLEEKFEEASHKLYDLLIAPVKSELQKNIIINVRAQMLQVPWDALVIKEATKTSKPHYLCRDHIIIIESDEANNSLVKNKLSNKQLLGIAPEFRGERYLNNGLEMEKISRYINVSLIRNETREKTILSIEERLSPIIHVSSHGKATKESNGIYIGKSSLLSIEQIEKLNIESDLVFLNSCESAKIVEAEDKFQSLCEAFMKAGAKSCIGTLWSIDDRSSMIVAENFYQFLSKGQSSSEALRNAKLKYLQNTTTKSEANPLYWGAYQLYGSDLESHDSLLLQIKPYISIAFSLMTTFSMISFYFGRRIKKVAIEYNII